MGAEKKMSAVSGSALRRASGIYAAAVLALAAVPGAAQAQVCAREITAKVVALDQPFFYNRLGAVNPDGMIYALRRDVVDSVTSKSEAEGGTLTAGSVMLRPDKRPRPLVLRMNAGDCLTVDFQNLLRAAGPFGEQPVTRAASVHAIGMQLVASIADDGSFVGANASSLANPGESRTYKLYAEREGQHLMYSGGAMTTAEGNGGTMAFGLFGSINVEPAGAEWYRSQLTQAEMQMATVGTALTGQPLLNYDAIYPTGHKFAGLPIINMLRGNEIVHGDINAIITGPGRGDFAAGTYPPVPVNEPNANLAQAPGAKASRPREEPFREFTVIFHDEIFAIQAFPGFFDDPVFSHTLHIVRDAFAINYGTGGIGSEIIANRLGVGPMFACVECKYEEFFLTSWAVGDPAMVVDIPANAGLEGLAPGQVPPAGAVGRKATKALYPDDPSNVHHAYLNDHTKFRNVHAGPKEHHIFHLHAHQWLFTPDSDKSTYLDSQHVGPGSGYTYEIAFNGAGNRNQTVGDAIFHCHFYPHFAMGMWEMWRNYDTFQTGTVLDGNGRPAAGARALPDAEILTGTPIPAVVPVPTLAMAPMPAAAVSIVNGQVQVTGAGNPGFPFFIPGVAGHRPPTPPLDVVDDGGLPRHVITAGIAQTTTTRLDFSKVLLNVDAVEVPEAGTAVEQAAMAFHAQRTHVSTTPEGNALKFVTNGLPPAMGAPFADPCMDDQGNATGNPRTYKGANIQLDVKLNKVGWHFPQQRILSLWGDVAATLNGTRPPEPFFIRGNSRDCITYYHTNLVPANYELDDYQVRTPTDVIGQHIHLVKFDVTSSDGSGNGWNYEDGTLSPEEVIERIHAINAGGGLDTSSGPRHLEPVAHPFFGVLGAMTTVQRWYADPILDNAGKDRTLQTVFTHDHYGPSTHQQVGLYASLIIEPTGSVWKHNETGAVLGGRFDGGPTSWQAAILTPNPADSFREFATQFGDFQHAYEAGGGVNAQGKPVPDPAKVIAPPALKEIGLPFLFEKAQDCPGGVPLPCPEAISGADVGTFVTNYRNEPVALRVFDPATRTQAAGNAGDLARVYSSATRRVIRELNEQPNFYPPLTAGLDGRDPFTPLWRVYEGDKVRIRVQTGSTEESHVVTINGVKWLQEQFENRSGWRNGQAMGISEHFELVTPIIPSVQNTADRLYRLSTSADGQWNGTWGIMRAYDNLRNDLVALPNNPDAGGGGQDVQRFASGCPQEAPERTFDITAVTAAVLPTRTLVYNSRAGAFAGHPGPLNDPTALLYFHSADLTTNGRALRPGRPIEPLILRARAGECIVINLRNRLPQAGNTTPDLPGFNGLPVLIERFNANQIGPSNSVGLHPQLVHFDVVRFDGMNVGLNADQLAAPNDTVTYRWYAGDVAEGPDGRLVATPVEFGAIGLMPADPIKGSNKGLVGALIVEPANATWVEDAGTRAQATVTVGTTSFREFVQVWQTDINLRDRNNLAIENTADAEDYEDSGQKAINYKTEPMWFRVGFAPDLPLEQTRDFDVSDALSNTITGGADPQTPVYTAKAGQAVRFRVVMPNGNNRNGVFQVHGHAWQREPYVAGAVASQSIGDNPTSQVIGAQEGMGPGNHFDVVPLNGAGGRFRVTGDYLYRDQNSFHFDGGLWGIFRVRP